jgi:5-methyltetrahydropteroyltriglutamate--homocysteine methyltransferase
MLDPMPIVNCTMKCVHVTPTRLKDILDLQVPEVQMLEPALCLFDAKQFQSLYNATYQALSPCVPINLVTFYDDVGDSFPWVSALPVKAISMDFCGVVRI